MEMRRQGVAGIAAKSEGLASVNLVAGVDANTAGLHMGVHGEDTAGEVGIVETEDDRVAVSLIERDAFQGAILPSEKTWEIVEPIIEHVRAQRWNSQEVSLMSHVVGIV